MIKKFEDVIAERGRLVYTNVGDSMFPIIREGDLLVIEAIREPLKVGDVPLYKRDSGQYVMHRIVGIRNGKYMMKGDNRTFVEKGITDKHIIGVLTGIVRNGITYPVETVPEYTVRIAKDLCYLVSCAVNENAPDAERLKTIDLREIYRLSREHMLTDAVDFALEKADSLPQGYFEIKNKPILTERMKDGRRITDEDFYIALICQMHQRYRDGRMGLRSLLDVYVYNRTHGEALDRRYLSAELKKRKAADFESEMRALAEKLFTNGGLSEREDGELAHLAMSGVSGSEKRGKREPKRSGGLRGKLSKVKRVLRRGLHRRNVQ